MSRGLSRRHTRTAKRALEPEPKIEREKIRRPPSRDSRLVEAETAIQPALGDDGAHADWTLQREEPQTWDDDSESDWVLEPDLDDDPETFDDEEFVGEEDVDEEYLEDDDGVIWEDDDLPDEMALDTSGQMVIEDGEDITFDDHDTGFGAAPEVELAGRRDVSPRSPKPAASPRTTKARRSAPGRTPRQQGQKQRKPRQQQAAREPLAQWEEPDQPAGRAGPPGLTPLEPTPRPAPVSKARSAPRPVDIEPVSRPRSQPAGDALPPARGRGTALTHSPAEALVIGDAPAQPLPQPSGGAAGRRRRQSTQKPRLAIPPSGHRSSGRRRRSGKGLLPLITVVVVGIFGWFGYQQIDPATIQPTLDRITSLLPFPASTRTAEDSSFGDQDGLENLTAEQALSYLEDRALSQSEAPPPADRTNGPPIPKFKPLANDGASSSATRSTATSGNEEGDTQDASIIEQIIRYINPG